MKRVLAVLLACVALATVAYAARQKQEFRILRHGWKITSCSQDSEIRWCNVMATIRNDTGKSVEWVQLEGSIFEKGVKIRTIKGSATNLEPKDVVELQMEPAVAKDKTEYAARRYQYRLERFNWRER